MLIRVLGRLRGPRTPRRGLPDGWPAQARFWVEWASHVADVVRRTKLDCAHAVGTDAFSPQRTSGAEARRCFQRLNGTNKFVPFPSPFVRWLRIPASARRGASVAQAASCPTFRKPRKVGHPELLWCRQEAKRRPARRRYTMRHRSYLCERHGS